MDKHVESVKAKLAQRSAVGIKKYGCTLERTDLNTIDFLRHAQEEAMDLACYLERIIEDMEANTLKVREM